MLATQLVIDLLLIRLFVTFTCLNTFLIRFVFYTFKCNSSNYFLKGPSRAGLIPPIFSMSIKPTSSHICRLTFSISHSLSAGSIPNGPRQRGSAVHVRPTSNASLMTSPGVKMVTRAASRPPPPYSSPSPSLVFQLDAMAPILFGFFSVSSGLRSTFLLCIEKGKVTTVHNANLMSVTALARPPSGISLRRQNRCFKLGFDWLILFSPFPLSPMGKSESN